MRDYDREWMDAKDAALKAVMVLHRNDEQKRPICEGNAAQGVTNRFDDMMKAFDNVCACLNRRIKVRDETIKMLQNELAEEKAK